MAPINKPTFEEIIAELKQRENKFLVVPLSDDLNLQKLLAVWSMVILIREKPPRWRRKTPIINIEAEYLRTFIWSTTRVDYAQLRELLGPTFPAMQTVNKAVRMQLAFPDNTIAKVADSMLSLKTNRLVKELDG